MYAALSRRRQRQSNAAVKAIYDFCPAGNIEAAIPRSTPGCGTPGSRFIKLTTGCADEKKPMAFHRLFSFCQAFS
jgi:hypothetical protein